MIATISFAPAMGAGSPGSWSKAEVLAVQSGEFEVVSIKTRDGYWQAVVIRRPACAVATWQYLGRAQDSDYVLLASTANFDAVDWPADREFETGTPTSTVLVESTADGYPLVWAQNPSGNGIKAFAGLGPDNDVVAVFLELY